MRLFRVILPVQDIDQAAAFYGAVLGEPGKRVSPNRHYFGGEDGAILACYQPVAEADSPGRSWKQDPLQYLYFSVDDLAKTRAACEQAGATDVTDVTQTPWGEAMFYAKDPFENPISFVQAGTEFTG